jgi:hypothetical protein
MPSVAQRLRVIARSPAMPPILTFRQKAGPQAGCLAAYDDGAIARLEQSETGMSADRVRSINASVVAIVAVSASLQCVALLAGDWQIDEGTAGRQIFSTVEMSLVALLLVQGWRIVRWSRDMSQSRITQQMAVICFYSLALCGLGDLVNRNYLEQYYQFDEIIKHSYLVTAIWFFFPAYTLIIVANRRITQRAIGSRVAATTVAVSALIGLLLYLTNHDPAVSHYSSGMILIYTMMLCVLAGSTLWLVRAYGWHASRIVVIGCLLALVADALVGNFWIYRDHYPTIEHVNWIVYFTSLAMIQQIPFLIAREGGAAWRD